MSRREECCPTCRRPLYLPELSTVTRPVRRRLVELIANHPEGITRAGLADLVYAEDPNGSPEWAWSSIGVAVFRANEQLRPQGYRITSSGGPGARYRLERTGFGQPEVAANAERLNGGARSGE